MNKTKCRICKYMEPQLSVRCHNCAKTDFGLYSPISANNKTRFLLEQLQVNTIEAHEEFQRKEISLDKLKEKYDQIIQETNCLISKHIADYIRNTPSRVSDDYEPYDLIHDIANRIETMHSWEDK